MMQITEDTPPDMLAGAMDLTVHLPTGRTVKMSVERSTPMMDLLVQITTAHHLQHSGHIIQALEMAPTSGHSDKILPYKPNTPIGALDTQHVKVFPKNRSVPVPKSVSVGHQPFESTFRLQVHLPRNQLYVIRVSQNIHLEDIMKKVCAEKNLDSVKYEFRHPGNLDEVLDPKLTLSDYQITEVYIVSKGTVGLTQAFSSSDIMALRKEEERKQLQARTGGGVFSLIFKRGKPSMGSGSLSSENRSISPSHSDDSRSVTPPAIQQQILPPISQEPEKPKAPQRKRRPAPKPPQQSDHRKDSTDKPPSQISGISDTNTNSSDSSGYHEPSVLSDNCNTSLPRRPKSTIINEVVSEETPSGEHSKNLGNLFKMSTFSKSTTSITSRKKKAAPPPPPTPPVLKTENAIPNFEKASPVVANAPVEKQAPPKPPPRIKGEGEPPKPTPRVKPVVVAHPVPQARSFASPQEDPQKDSRDGSNTNHEPTKTYYNNDVGVAFSTNDKLMAQLEAKMEEPRLISNINADIYKSTDTLVPDDNDLDIVNEEEMVENESEIGETDKKLPEIIAVIPKKSESLTSLSSHASSFDTAGRKRGFHIGTSMLSMNDDADDEGRSTDSPESPHKENSDTASIHSKNSCYTSSPVDDYEVNDFNVDIFQSSLSKNSKNAKKILQELHGIHSLESEEQIMRNRSISSLRSSESMPSFLELSNIKKWNNVHELDHISMGSDTVSFGRSKWVVGDTSDTDSISTPLTKESPRGSIASSKHSSRLPSRQESTSNFDPETQRSSLPKQSPRESPNSSNQPSRKGSHNSIVAENHVMPQPQTEIVPKTTLATHPQPISPNQVALACEINEVDQGIVKSDAPEELVELDSEWQYQLPSPPTAFRDSSPTNMTDVTNYDTITLQDFKAESVVTNPELFEKLRVVKESRCETETISDFNSVMSDDDKPMLSKLTLENLEKRKSLVYNRELSTSLKIAQETVSSSSINNNNNNRNVDGSSSKRSSILSELEEVLHNGGNKAVSRRNSCVTEKVAQSTIDSNLPNFKISTYDKPKNKINIFEDDSIRSNVETSYKTNSSMDLSGSTDFSLDNNKLIYAVEKPFFTNRSTLIGRSMENIAYRKNSIENHAEEDVFKKPVEFAKYKASRSNFYVKHQPDMPTSVMRSESFSSNHNMAAWKPHNPVQRSKSQVALNKYRDEQETKTDNDDGLSKSNSLFDVSGLQSLEVMRMIQTKLNTPSNSTEQLLETEGDISKPPTSARSSISLDHNHSNQPQQGDPDSTTNTKTYRYQGPPAINLSTWSERPKTKVSLKEDTDYKINSHEGFNTKAKLNSYMANGNGVEIKHFTNNSLGHTKNQADSNNVSIKINGTEPITTQEYGNVVIKIGETQPAKTIDNFSTRFINHTTAMGYRKPLANINKIEKTRPHSVAFDSEFDISRVPIVRAVELKKTFKEAPQVNNTSVTQINALNNETTSKYADIYRSTESIGEVNGLKPVTKNSSVYLSLESVNKPVVRVNSFAQSRPVPVVMGFRGAENGNDNTARSRKSWNVPNSYSTLPLKVPEAPAKPTSFVPNSNVPFSKISLKRIDSNKVPSVDGNVTNGNHVFGNVVLRNTSSQIRANNNHRFSTGSQFGVESNRRYSNSNGTDFGGTPPPPPLMPKVTSVTKKVDKYPEPSGDTRDELLNSIRNFGGMKGFRNVKA